MEMQSYGRGISSFWSTSSIVRMASNRIPWTSEVGEYSEEY